MDEDEEVCEFQAGEVYNPEMPSGTEAFTAPQTRSPLQPRAFIMLETPFIKNLK